MKFLNPNETAVFALGGLGEVGKNTYCIQHKDEILIIDAGVKFPEVEELGIDYVIPDYTYLANNQEMIKALIITHGHEDHIGGLPFMLKKVSIPTIYTPKLAAGLIKNKLEDRREPFKGKMKLLNEKEIIKTKYFKVTFFRTSHSIPDSYGIAIESPNGVIVHTGDFKFDHTPIGEPANIGRMAELGNKGVLLLLSDSTNAEVAGMTLSEQKVDETLNNIFHRVDGRIIIATFASNVHRLKHIIETSVKHKRKVAVFGRSMEAVIKIAMEQGIFTVPKETFIDGNYINNHPKNEITILCTGSQGEPLAALSRIANGSHRQIKLIPGDTVVFSSSPIPGNAASVGRTINLLHRHGATVYTNQLMHTHTSGHAAQEELKLMLRLVRPKYFMPVHGEYRMLKIHAKLGEDCDVPRQNNFVLENGQVLALTADTARVAGEVPAADVYVDGSGIGDIGSVVIKDRKILSNDGVVVVAASIDMKQKKLLAVPNIQTRGFVLVKENEELMKEIEIYTNRVVENKLGENKPTFTDLKNEISDKLQGFIFEKTQRRPMILTVIMDVK